MAVGFIGLGAMGEAMALRLAGAGEDLIVWNRNATRALPLAAAGAAVAKNPAEVFASASVVILMLADARAIDAVLARGTPAFAARVRGKTIINMATIAISESSELAGAIGAANGTYIEAPVSGSRKPAEAGQLVAMVAGPADCVDSIRGLLSPLCRSIIDCGAVPGALAMKLSINVTLIAMVTGLAEAVHLARHLGVDLERFAEVLQAGPMANDVLRVKLPKLLENDFAAQAAIRNVHDNCRLIALAAEGADTAVPLTAVCKTLYRETMDKGFGDEDMVAVIRAITERE